MFEIHDLQVNFGGIQALKGISLSVEDGQIVTLIGANGAGKTTTLRTASGLERPSGGTITLAGQDITRASARERVKQGLVQVPEGRRVFPKMSVLENLELGAFLRKDRAGITRDLRDVYERFPVLADRLKQQAGTLSGGEQQMLAMGRALMSRPKMLLLDEPSMGLAPLFVQEIFDIIKAINEAGTTVLLVEQNANMALQIADHAYVMETGRIVLSGTPAELSASDEIKRAYLGG
ncbi:ABC protein of Branched-chain amino acid ABC transporter (HAA:undef) [Propionibacterium freudenreichii]|uniref:ABC transporter ATP-binding protein n=1 Tax=Propionibacterium freudenreichii TaxID=1744 RepID=UPI0005A5C71B|nr:ABC transporter ATP-binding protein [Propionibacterium freudenreichii]CEI24941.1 ABC protein of Branched-chain amino acid ABC transporter (HAA:undef) [Propionibacterium freudenreichii]